MAMASTTVDSIPTRLSTPTRSTAVTRLPPSIPILRRCLKSACPPDPWARVIANYGPVRHITNVEINPGYIELMKHYSEQGSLLTDPKVTIHVDDGRRWLKRHPEARFDFILQNTIVHWRNLSTNVLSEEYLRLSKAHLKLGGVLFINATTSENIAYTLSRVFKHMVFVGSFIAASDSPFSLSPEQIRANLLKFSSGTRPAPSSTQSNRRFRSYSTAGPPFH